MPRKENGGTPVLDDYLRDFGLSETDLTGKRILDLGAGARQFAFDCHEAGIGSVWSVDFREAWLATLRMMETGKRMRVDSPVLRQWREVGRKSVEATMERLPFGNETFDWVLSRDALSHVFAYPDPMGRSLLEAARVLAPGGEARIFPGWLENWAEEEKDRVARALKVLAEGDRVKIELVEIERALAGRRTAGAMIVLKKIEI